MSQEKYLLPLRRLFLTGRELLGRRRLRWPEGNLHRHERRQSHCCFVVSGLTPKSFRPVVFEAAQTHTSASVTLTPRSLASCLAGAGHVARPCLWACSGHRCVLPLATVLFPLWLRRCLTLGRDAPPPLSQNVCLVGVFGGSVWLVLRAHLGRPLRQPPLTSILSGLQVSPPAWVTRGALCG